MKKIVCNLMLVVASTSFTVKAENVLLVVDFQNEKSEKIEVIKNPATSQNGVNPLIDMINQLVS